MNPGWQTSTNSQTGYTVCATYAATFLFTDPTGISTGGAAGNFPIWCRKLTER